MRSIDVTDADRETGCGVIGLEHVGGPRFSGDWAAFMPLGFGQALFAYPKDLIHYLGAGRDDRQQFAACK